MRRLGARDSDSSSSRSSGKSASEKSDTPTTKTAVTEPMSTTAETASTVPPAASRTSPRASAQNPTAVATTCRARRPAVAAERVVGGPEDELREGGHVVPARARRAWRAGSRAEGARGPPGRRAARATARRRRSARARRAAPRTPRRRTRSSPARGRLLRELRGLGAWPRAPGARTAVGRPVPRSRGVGDGWPDRCPWRHVCRSGLQRAHMRDGCTSEIRGDGVMRRTAASLGLTAGNMRFRPSLGEPIRLFTAQVGGFSVPPCSQHSPSAR